MVMNINKFSANAYFSTNKKSSQYKADNFNCQSDQPFDFKISDSVTMEAVESNLEKSANILVKNSDKTVDNIVLSDDYKKWLKENYDKQEQDDVEKSDGKENEDFESPEKQTIGGKVAVNVLKRMRQISAASDKSQMQQVLAILNDDLSDCKAGLEKGWCDQSEVAKVKSLINTAKEKMSQLPQNEKTEKDSQDYLDEFKFIMASLQ